MNLFFFVPIRWEISNTYKYKQQTCLLQQLMHLPDLRKISAIKCEFCEIYIFNSYLFCLFNFFITSFSSNLSLSLAFSCRLSPFFSWIANKGKQGKESEVICSISYDFIFVPLAQYNKKKKRKHTFIDA